VNELKELGVELKEFLNLKTLPLGIKFFEKIEDMDTIPKVRKMDDRLALCQYLTLSRTIGWTIGITKDNLIMPACMWMLGFTKIPEEMMDGSISKGIWMERQKDAQKYNENLPRIPYGKYKALVVSPLASGRIEDSDLVLIFGSPIQMNLIMNGLQWRDYERLTFYFSGEESCGDAIVECLKSGKPQLTIPCVGERRFGHVQDDELEMALPPASLKKAVEGLHGLRKAGTIKYPMPFYGPQASPRKEIEKVYPKIAEYIERLEAGEENPEWPK